MGVILMFGFMHKSHQNEKNKVFKSHKFKFLRVLDQKETYSILQTPRNEHLGFRIMGSTIFLYVWKRFCNFLKLTENLDFSSSFGGSYA